jgi:hypothetical protein
MDSDKDDEYLIWIAKRLVFKYKESPDIIKVINRIILKNRAIRSIFLENYNNNHIALTKAIEYLTNLQKINSSSFQSLQNKINLNFQPESLDKTKQSILETVDIDSFLKGV